MSELFVIASKAKFRFSTTRGNVSVEDLWDIPLTGQDFSLNKVAQDLSKQLKALGEEDFVSIKVAKDKTLEQKLDLVKYVIAARLKEAKAHSDAVAKKEIRNKARQILADREDEKFTELSDKELKKLAK